MTIYFSPLSANQIVSVIRKFSFASYFNIVMYRDDLVIAATETPGEAGHSPSVGGYIGEYNDQYQK